MRYVYYFDSGNIRYKKRKGDTKMKVADSE